jgi:hypothetical protein
MLDFCTRWRWASIPALWATQLNQWVPAVDSPGIKRAEREVDHLHAMSRLRMTGVVPIFTIFAFMVWIGTILSGKESPVRFWYDALSALQKAWTLLRREFFKSDISISDICISIPTELSQLVVFKLYDQYLLRQAECMNKWKMSWR